jgi:Ca2+-binding RTX toxin-like protein
VAGRSGADVLVGGPGRDTARGDAGDDLIAARDGAVDVLQCGGGQDRIAVDNGPPGPSDAPVRPTRDGIDDPFEIPVIDASRRTARPRDVLAGGGVGGGPAGSPLNPKAVVDVTLPYAVVTVLRAVGRHRRERAAADDVLRPRRRALRRDRGAAGVGRDGRPGADRGSGGARRHLPGAARRRNAHARPSGPVRVVATLTVHDALGREAVSRFAVTLRAA